MLGHDSSPDWQEIFEILVADEVDDVSFTVKDDNWIGESAHIQYNLYHWKHVSKLSL